jgi:hypothetical protein
MLGDSSVQKEEPKEVRKGADLFRKRPILSASILENSDQRSNRQISLPRVNEEGASFLRNLKGDID